MDDGTMLDRLKRLLPPPAPTAGWGMVRLMAAAHALGPAATTRSDEALQEMRLGARVAGGNIVADTPGSGSFWTDIWGDALGVPRLAGELDVAYRARILAECTVAGTANYGMAGLVDRVLGTEGTQVLDAADFIVTLRLCDGHRLAGGRRLMALGAWGADTLENSFVILTPGGLLPTDEDKAVRELADRRRSAGNRLLTIMPLTGAPIIDSDPYAIVGVEFQASVMNPDPGATYTWTTDNGAITAGQGTTVITILPDEYGSARLVATQVGGAHAGAFGVKHIPVVGIIVTTISCPDEAQAGESITASVPVAPGAIYTWTAAGGYILAGQGTNTVSVAMGEAVPEGQAPGTTCQLTCAIRQASTGALGSGSAPIKILPYPTGIVISAPDLAFGAHQTGVLAMGKDIEVTAITTSAPARVRLYATAAQRDADIARPVSTNPSGDHGIIAEVYTTPAALSVPFNPEAEGQNGDVPASPSIYYTLENLTAGTAAITATVAYTKRA